MSPPQRDTGQAVDQNQNDDADSEVEQDQEVQERGDKIDDLNNRIEELESEDFLGKSFGKDPNPLKTKSWRRGWDSKRSCYRLLHIASFCELECSQPVAVI
jgi:hypothetical protein